MPSPTIFSYSFKDENGSPDSTPIFVAYDADTVTVASLLGAAADYGGKLDAVSGAVITGFSVTITALPDPSWKTSTAADIDNEKTLLLNFNAADTKYPQDITVPAIKGSLIDAHGQPIIGTGAIKTLTDAIAAGSGAIYPNNKFLLDLTSLRNAALTFRKVAGSLAKSRVTP